MANVYVTREGRRWSPEMWEAVKEWRRLAKLEGIPFVITQGGFNQGGVLASAGTHDGDAIDVDTQQSNREQVARLIAIGRMVGIAAWYRTTSIAKYGTRAQGFGEYHVHGVPNGWGYPSRGAKAQVQSTRNGKPAGYRNGRDGLKTNQADIGPGHVGNYRTRTWKGYLAANTKPAPKPAPKPKEEDIMAGITKAELAAIVQAQTRAAMINVLESKDRYTEYVDEDGKGRNTRSLVDILFSAHANAIGANRTIAAVAAETGMDEKQVVAGIVAGISGVLSDSVKKQIKESLKDVSDTKADDIAKAVVNEIADTFAAGKKD